MKISRVNDNTSSVIGSPKLPLDRPECALGSRSTGEQYLPTLYNFLQQGLRFTNVIIMLQRRTVPCFMQRNVDRKNKAFLINKYERYYWTRKAPACLLTLLCHYGKPRLCINIHHYTPPTGSTPLIELQSHWLQQAAAILMKVQRHILNR